MSLLAPQARASVALTGARTTDMEGTLINLPTAKPHWPRFDMRPSRTLEQIARMGESLLREGQKEPVLCHLRDGEPELIDGFTRVKGALHVGLQEIQVRLLERTLSDEELLVTQAILNDERNAVSELDRVMHYLRIMEVGQCNQKELAKKVGKSPAAISRTLRWWVDLPEDVRGKVGEGDGRICPGIAYYLAFLKDQPEQMRLLADKAMNGQLVRDDAKQRVAELLGKKKAKKGRTARWSVGGAVLEYPTDWTLAKLTELCQQLLTQARRGANKDIPVQ